MLRGSCQASGGKPGPASLLVTLARLEKSWLLKKPACPQGQGVPTGRSRRPSQWDPELVLLVLGSLAVPLSDLPGASDTGSASTQSRLAAGVNPELLAAAGDTVIHPTRPVAMSSP